MAVASGASRVWPAVAPASPASWRKTYVGICGVRCGPSSRDASAAARTVASKPSSAAVTEQGDMAEAKRRGRSSGAGGGPWELRFSRVVQIKLVNLKYKPCDRDAVAPGSSLYKAKCFRITGETINPTGLTVYNADVFGFVLDAYDEPALPNRGRLASIKEIPPGKGKFEIEIVVPASETLPLQLKNFRATGFLGEVNRELNPYEYTDNK